MSADIDLSGWQRLGAATRADDPVTAVFAEVDQALQVASGHRLLTVLVYFEARGESMRAYSSQPDSYPVGGRKTLGDAPRMREVLASGKPFLGQDRQAIIDNYADHALLLKMGCESIVNMPVLWGARVLGTVNLLDSAGHYCEDDLPLIASWAQAALPAFLATLESVADSKPR